MATSINANSFVTLDEMRRHLQLPLEDVSPNGRLMDIANAVADGIESLIGHAVKETAYSNVLMTGDGSDTLALRQWPVATTPAPVIKVSTSHNFAAETALVFWNNDSGQDFSTAELVAADAEAGLLQRIDGGIFPRYPSNCVLASYTAGLTSSQWAPLLEASLMLVGYYFNGEGRDLTLASMNMGGVSRQWRDGGIPQRAREIILRYSSGGSSL
jgi:hypothetical protein